MTTEMKAEILELGETFVTLLKSPICPPEVRTAIVSHLDQVRKQLDMTNPDLVRSVFSFLASTSGLPPTASTTLAQNEAISTVLAAASAPIEFSRASLPTIAAQPLSAVTTASATPVIQSVLAAASVAPTPSLPSALGASSTVGNMMPTATVAAVEATKSSSGNLAARLSASVEEA